MDRVNEFNFHVCLDGSVSFCHPSLMTFENMLADPENIRVITQTMFPPFPAVQADIGIVLGAGIATPFVISRAAELLRERALSLDHLILCGGRIINALPETAAYLPFVKDFLFSERLPLPRDRETEADYMVRYLKRFMVSQSHFTLENTSANTRENLANARRTNAFRRADSLNLIGLLPTRALMTLRKLEVQQKRKPTVATITNVIPFKGVTPDNWQNFPQIAAYVFKEYQKINPEYPYNYITQQQCLKINLDTEIRCAQALLPRHFMPPMPKPVVLFG